MMLLLFALASPAAAQEKRIALTFDDVPRGEGAWLTPDQRTKMLIAALKKSGVKQAAFFVTPGNLLEKYGEGGEKRIKAYVRAGHVIANHTFVHPQLSALTANAYLDDIDRADRWLKDRPGFRRWFRYPYLNEGRQDKEKRDAVRVGLAKRGYRNGYVTAESSDWFIESMASDAVKAGKAIDRDALRNLYVESHVQAANFYDALAIKTLGRSPAHVMLLHENDVAAYYIGDLVSALKADGWTIITADEAYADPLLLNAAPDVPSAQGALIELMAWEKKLPAPRWYERNDEAVLEKLFREQVLKEAPPTP